MKSRRFGIIGVFVSACAVSHCTSSKGTGDETHFWCSTNDECKKLGEGYECRQNECRIAMVGAQTATGGSGPDAGDPGGGGTGGQGPASSGGTAGNGGASSGGSSGGGSVATEGGAGGASSGGAASGGSAPTGGTQGAGGEQEVFPPNLPDPSPGPAVDCNSTWPANTATFATTAGRIGTPQFGAFELGPVGINLNRNGTAIVALITTHQIVTGGAEDLVQGQLIRWTGDTLSRLGQPPSEGLNPVSVDCGATTIAGSTYHPTDPIRWSTADGFTVLPPAAAGSVTAGGKYQVIGVSPDGSTTFGTYAVSGEPTVAVRWRGGAAEPLFTLPETDAKATHMSRDGSTLLGYTTSGQPFVRPLAGSSATLLPTTGIEYTSAISGDGTVVAGVLPSDVPTDTAAVRAFVWSARDGLEILPNYTVITSITSNRAAVGFLTGFQPGPDLEMVWDPNHGVRHLRDVLATHGVTVPNDVTLFNTHAISDDARVIVAVCTDASDPFSMHLCRAVLPENGFD